MNKKGAEMTIGTIIVIILALIVLVVIIYGFTTGWSGLWNNIVNFVGGQTNVETIIKSCTVACTSQSAYDYCDLNRTITFPKRDATGKEVIVSTKTTCQVLAMGGQSAPNVKNGNSELLPGVQLSCPIDCTKN